MSILLRENCIQMSISILVLSIKHWVSPQTCFQFYLQSQELLVGWLIGKKCSMTQRIKSSDPDKIMLERETNLM